MKEGMEEKEGRKEGIRMYIVKSVIVIRSTQLLTCWAC